MQFKQPNLLIHKEYHMKKIIILIWLTAVTPLLHATYPYNVTNPAASGDDAKGAEASAPLLNLESIKYMILSSETDFASLNSYLLYLLAQMSQFFSNFDAQCPDALIMLQAAEQNLFVIPADTATNGLKQALDLINATPISPNFTQLMYDYLTNPLTFYYNNLLD